MVTTSKISKDGLNLIKSFEGLHDGNKKTPILEPMLDPVGYPTIGWGSRYDINGIVVTMKTKPITLVEAEILLLKTVKVFERAVRKAITVPLNQNQFDALCSLAYNIGTAAFSSASICGHINKSSAVRADFTDYSHARDQKTGKLVVLQGLLDRRNKEADLFFSNDKILYNGLII